MSFDSDHWLLTLAAGAAIAVLIAGILIYASCLGVAFFTNRKPTWRALFERSINHSVGLPVCAVSAFGLVSLLAYRGTQGEQGELTFKAFSLEFTGPSGPLLLWVVSYVTLVWSIRAASKVSE